jgi:hypothetical protein
MRNSKLIFSAAVAISAILGIGAASAATLRQMNQYPMIVVYKCDKCRTIATIPAQAGTHQL